MTSNVRLTLSLGDTTPGFTIVLSKTIRIGDTKYNISVALFIINWKFHGAFIELHQNLFIKF